jgi:hypothetical protein
MVKNLTGWMVSHYLALIIPGDYMLAWQAIEHGMVKSFNCCHPLFRFHSQNTLHEVHGTLRHLANIPLLEGFWLAHLWELQADKAWVLPEQLRLLVCQ